MKVNNKRSLKLMKLSFIYFMIFILGYLAVTIMMYEWINSFLYHRKNKINDVYYTIKFYPRAVLRM